MGICPRNILNHFLCCSNIKFPMYKGHYMTGKNISIFSNLACIENNLNNLTCSCKNTYNNLFLHPKK
ncbi:MAG: hypothetical protein RSA08_03315 [Clostridia bacterium]